MTEITEIITLCRYIKVFEPCGLVIVSDDHIIIREEITQTLRSMPYTSLQQWLEVIRLEYTPDECELRCSESLSVLGFGYSTRLESENLTMACSRIGLNSNSKTPTC